MPAAVDPALTERQVAILRHLSRHRRGLWSIPIADAVGCTADQVAVDCQDLMPRGFLDGYSTGWRITTAGRKAIGAPPLPPRRRGDELRGGGRP
jgi:hypothetical protein